MRNARLILNKYLPLKEIGSGGFGTVFVCKDMLMQRLVAIKKIELSELDAQRASWVHDDINRDAQIDALNAFETGHATINLLSEEKQDSLTDSLERRYLAKVPGLDEARMAAALCDPSIVAMYDCQIAGNVVYLVMEYVEGTTLTQILADYNQEITLDIIACVFESVSHALAVAHKHGVLHFDVKPDNVLIDAQGKVKVTDFGLATLSDAQGEGTAAAGTIGYMPPEQMRQETLDARTDEWALASIVYEMLVGQNPFLAQTLEQALQCIDGAELTLPSYCWDDMPEEIDDVLFKALDPQKEERFESVAEFAHELEPFLGDVSLGTSELAALVQGGSVEDVLNEEANADACDAESVHAGGIAEAARTFFARLRTDRSTTQKSLAARALAAAESGLVSALGAWNIAGLSGVDNPLFWAFVVACVALGAVIPSVGALVSFTLVSAALLASGAQACGILLLAATALWWWSVGRHARATVVGLLSFPLLSAVGLVPVSTLLTGYTTKVPQALATVALGGFVCLICASFGSLDLMNWNVAQYGSFADLSSKVASLGSTSLAVDSLSAVPLNENMLALLTRASTWILLISWEIAALVTSLLVRLGRRVFAVVGACGGFFVIMAGIWVACALGLQATSTVPSAPLLVSAVASGAVMLFVSLAMPLPKR